MFYYKNEINIITANGCLIEIHGWLILSYPKHIKVKENIKTHARIIQKKQTLQNWANLVILFRFLEIKTGFECTFVWWVCVTTFWYLSSLYNNILNKDIVNV